MLHPHLYCLSKPSSAAVSPFIVHLWHHLFFIICVNIITITTLSLSFSSSCHPYHHIIYVYHNFYAYFLENITTVWYVARTNTCAMITIINCCCFHNLYIFFFNEDMITSVPITDYIIITPQGLLLLSAVLPEPPDIAPEIQRRRTSSSLLS